MIPNAIVPTITASVSPKAIFQPDAPTGSRPALASIQEKRGRIGILVPDLIDGLFLAPSRIKPVGCVEHQTGDFSHVAISMNNAGRNPDRSRIGGAHGDDRAMPPGLAVRA